jgi:2-methylisocitrate lyase-like PEP mutase family enzyme
MLAHIAAIVAGTDLPVNADFGNGFAEDPEQLAQHVRQCVAAGVAGLSIEDATGDRGTPLYPLAQAVERVRAARQAAGDDVVLTARAEGFLVGRPDLDDVLTRLQAFAAAGADCLYAPGLRHRDEIAAVVGAVAPKPVNVLMSAPIGFTVTDLAALGVRRVSVGSGLARAAWGGFVRAARELLARGTFEAFADATPFAELDGFFTADKSRRR